MIALVPFVIGALAIVNAKIEVGDGTVIDKGTIVVDNGKIIAVGANAAVPAGAERIDANGKVVTPGIIAPNESTGIVEVGLEKAGNDARVNGKESVPAFRAVDGFNPASPRVAIEREQGVTSVIVTPQGGLLYGQGFAVDLSGATESAAKAKRVAMFGAFAGSAKDAVGGARGSALLRLREIFDDVRFYQANKGAYDKAAARELSLPRVHLEALIDVVDGKLPVVFDVHRASDIIDLIAFAQEQKIKVIVNGGAEAWVVAKQIAAAKVPVILEPMNMLPESFDMLRAREDTPAILQKAGVTVVIASDSSGGLGTTRMRQQAGWAVANGMAHEEALRAITSAPASVFGLVDEGTIAVGKRADLVVWTGDPFETSTFTDAVIIGGEKMSLDTRQKELVQKYRVLK